MGRYLALGVLIVVVMVFAGSSRSQGTTAPPPLATLPPEPTIGPPITPAPGSESVAKNPFAPYGIGAASAAWRYEDLSLGEKDVADRGRNVAGAAGVQSAYAQLAREQGQRALAIEAARRLGVQALAETGVVP